MVQRRLQFLLFFAVSPLCENSWQLVLRGLLGVHHKRPDSLSWYIISLFDLGKKSLTSALENRLIHELEVSYDPARKQRTYARALARLLVWGFFRCGSPSLRVLRRQGTKFWTQGRS
jgi:hypothetical protein